MPSKTKRVHVSRLVTGTYVQKIDGAWLDHGFWRRSFLVRDQQTLNELLNCGAEHVWIDLERGIDVPEEAEEQTAEEPPAIEAGETGDSDEGAQAEDDDDLLMDLADAPDEDEPVAAAEAAPIQPAAASGPRQLDPHEVKLGKRGSRLHREERASPPSEEDWRRAQKVCSLAKRVVTKVFDDIRNGRDIETASIMPVVDCVIETVGDQPGTMTSLARLKQQDQYTFMHSVAVCALMTTLALELGLDDDAVREAATGGLVHDIGKMAVDMNILNKPGKLSDEEFEQIKMHTTAGHQILELAGGVGPVPLDIARHHHERIDGRGYPDALAGDEISLFARMGTICDVYDAVTSDRPYKKAWEPTVALHQMTKWSKGAYDEVIFQAFVKSIGVYPNGSLVRLASGRLAVVLDQHHKSLLTPVVKVFFSSKSAQPLPHQVIDLASPLCYDKIVAREDPARWGFKDLTPLWVPVDMRRI